ncbi:MAG: twin-arginine translocation signal domain-containing protein [Candidatus Azotimanducaceae bacterium]|jgi:DNA-directed RNA polymerase specialized sigma subunit
MSKSILERRKFLKFLGVSSAGLGVASAMAASKEKINDGSDQAKEEIERLKEAYENLDGRSKLILRLLLALSGLDILLAI